MVDRIAGLECGLLAAIALSMTGCTGWLHSKQDNVVRLDSVTRARLAEDVSTIRLFAWDSMHSSNFIQWDPITERARAEVEALGYRVILLSAPLDSHRPAMHRLPAPGLLRQDEAYLEVSCGSTYFHTALAVLFTKASPSPAYMRWVQLGGRRDDMGKAIRRALSGIPRRKTRTDRPPIKASVPARTTGYTDSRIDSTRPVP